MPPHHSDRIPGFFSSNEPRAQEPSEWTVVFDTETTTDAAQRLRIGSYQVRKGVELEDAGLFFDPGALSNDELATLKLYASDRGLEVRTVAEFVTDIFSASVTKLRATIVGFNLPFDISRLAMGHGSARGKAMRGGFSFKFSADKGIPRIQVKHLGRRAALIQFTKPAQQDTPRGMRKRGMTVQPHRGFFVGREDHNRRSDREFPHPQVRGRFVGGAEPQAGNRRSWGDPNRGLHRLCLPRRSDNMGVFRGTPGPIWRPWAQRKPRFP